MQAGHVIQLDQPPRSQSISDLPPVGSSGLVGTRPYPFPVATFPELEH